MSKFAEFLKAELDRQACTQAELAAKMGLHRSVLASMVNAQRLNVSILVFCRICQGLPSWDRRILLFKAVYDDVVNKRLEKREG